MNSKPFKSLLVAICAAVLVVPLAAGSLAGAVTSAFQPGNIPYPGGADGTLSQDPPSFITGQDITLIANFDASASGQVVTLFKETSPGSGNYTSTGNSDAANTNGNAYITNYEVNGDQRVFAQSSGGLVTEIDFLDPVSGNAVLNPISLQEGAGSHDAKATFSPITAGTKTELQVKTIKDGTWKTIATDTQRASGHTYFSIADPLEVEHQYRARKGGITTNTVTFAAPLVQRANDIPTVHFNSNDGEAVNTRSTWFDGEFAIKGGLTDQDKNGSFENCAGVGPFEAEMRGRGNYSWSFSKKGFNLKFPNIDNDGKYDLCDMGKSRKWALIANHYDRSLLRNSAANFVGEQMGNLEFTPKEVSVDLYVNGSYRGTYMLIERVNFEGGRLDEEELKSDDDTAAFCSNLSHPDLSGSYLMEWDFRKGAYYNFTAGSRGWVGLKEPEDEDYCGNMGKRINEYVDIADRDLFDGSANDNDWMSSIDLDSAVDYYIAMEYLKPVDGQMWASVYMYKPRGEKIHFGPLWDFDLAMGSATRAGNVASPQSWYLRNPLNISAKQSEKTWFNRLNENATFRAAVRERWNEVDQDINDVIAYLRQQEGLIDKSADDNYRKWSHGSKISEYQVIKSSWGADVDHLVNFLDKRWIWMDGQLDNND
jgi:hypothetical protein